MSSASSRGSSVGVPNKFNRHGQIISQLDLDQDELFNGSAADYNSKGEVLAADPAAPIMNTPAAIGPEATKPLTPNLVDFNGFRRISSKTLRALFEKDDPVERFRQEVFEAEDVMKGMRMAKYSTRTRSSLFFKLVNVLDECWAEFIKEAERTEKEDEVSKKKDPGFLPTPLFVSEQLDELEKSFYIKGIRVKDLLEILKRHVAQVMPLIKGVHPNMDMTNCHVEFIFWRLFVHSSMVVSTYCEMDFNQYYIKQEETTINVKFHRMQRDREKPLAADEVKVNSNTDNN